MEDRGKGVSQNEEIKHRLTKFLGNPAPKIVVLFGILRFARMVECNLCGRG